MLLAMLTVATPEVCHFIVLTLLPIDAVVLMAGFIVSFSQGFSLR
jgi:hypothetical protein